MRGLVLEQPERIVLRDDLAEPVLVEDRDAIVRVHAAGLCGSDLHPYEGREAVRLGVVQGHEFVGEVVAVGPAVANVAPGDRVLAAFTTSCGLCEFCRAGLSARCLSSQLFGYGSPDLGMPVLHGGQAEYARVPLADHTLVAVPAGLEDAEAVLLTDNLPTAWYAVRRAEVQPGSAVAVVGLGSVGLLAVRAAWAAGAASVVAVDPVPDRRERAADLRANAMHPVDAAELRGRFAGVVDAAGTPAAQRLAFDLVRPGGTLSAIAVQTAQAFAFTPVEAYDRNITVRTGRAPVRSLLDDLLPGVATGDLTEAARIVITDVVVPLEQGPELYRRFAARDPGLVKAVFAPQLRG